ncbi:hypothetical protein ACHAXT_009521 [Thalassiosira profunda]
MSTASMATTALAALSLLLPPTCSGLLPAAPARRPATARSGLAERRASRIRISTTHHLSAAADDGSLSEGGEEPHLHGIGVGIDLGTTNSALAMMVPAEDGSPRTVPTMIEVDHEGRTIPSVVSFVFGDEIDGASEQLSLPPWTDQAVATATGASIEWPDWDNSYQIHVGNTAIDDEQTHPNSTYRNVKRIMGTGGRMAELATGVVPNLYIGSVNDAVSGDSVGVSPEGLEDIFNILESDEKSKPKGKKKKRKRKGSKWKRKKQSELPKLHKQLEAARDDPALLTCNINGNAASSAAILRPEQISACILRKLYDTAESRSNEEAKVTRAVIGVPAYFTDAQRQATIRASELAGVPKVKLLPEPEAAALAYGAASAADSDEEEMTGYYDKEELILVFDLGGGTFDVSVLEVGGGVTEVLATVGNNRLGGTDFDKRVAEYLSGCAAEHGRKSSSDAKRTSNGEVIKALEDDSGNKKARRRPVKDWYRQGSGEVPDIILRVAEEARKSLSNQKVVEVRVPLTEEGWRKVGGDESLSNVIGPFDASKIEADRGMLERGDYTIVSLDRKIFEAVCYNELQMLLQPIREVAIMAGVLLPGDARPSFVENAMEMADAMEMGGEGFWDFDDEDDDEDELLVKTGHGGAASVESDASEEVLNEQALRQLEMMDIKAQKKAQQRGRRKARDIDKRERSFRKQKRSAMEEATEASLLGKQLGGKQKRGGGAAAASAPQPTSVSVGNERVQEGIHGRPLSRIVLVGGATRMPVIGKLLEAVVGMVPQRTVHPDEAVALGCAVQVGILDGENEGLLGGAQAVLSPMQAAIMKALAKKRGMDVSESGELSMRGDEFGGISGMVVDEFDDEEDFY